MTIAYVGLGSAEDLGVKVPSATDRITRIAASLCFRSRKADGCDERGQSGESDMLDVRQSIVWQYPGRGYGTHLVKHVDIAIVQTSAANGEPLKLSSG